MRSILAFSCLFLFCLSTGPSAAIAADRAKGKPGHTEIQKWPEGKKACFMLAYDDSAPTQLKNAIPEHNKRKMVGNFYMVTGNATYNNMRTQWEEAVKSPYVSIANHTNTHTGATNPEILDMELSKCNEVLYALRPDREKPYLLGFGKPGGVPWTITDEELKIALAKNNLVNRPPFMGPPLSFKSAAESVAVIEKALANGAMGHLDFHGVGGDWHSTPLDWYTEILDTLEKHRDEFWITDVVSWHQYEKERDGSKVTVAAADAKSIRLKVTNQLDKDVYNFPLTLSTVVPADWKGCTIVQGESREFAKAVDGVLTYQAYPIEREIVITPVR